MVAFEADSLDTDRYVGWSVTIGQAQEVTDPDEIGRLEQIGLSSWTRGERKHFMRISPGTLNGRRLSAPGSEHLHRTLQECGRADNF